MPSGWMKSKKMEDYIYARVEVCEHLISTLSVVDVCVCVGIMAFYLVDRSSCSCSSWN